MLATLLSLFVAPAPVTLLVQLPALPRLAEVGREEGLALTRQAVERGLGDRLLQAGYRAEFLAVDGAFDRPPGAAEAARLRERGFARVTVVRVEKLEQKNRSHEEMIDHPNAPKSQTKVAVRVWVLSDGRVEDGKRREATAGGAYFGTTDRSDMSGSPEAKALSIRLTNDRRTAALAGAV